MATIKDGQSGNIAKVNDEGQLAVAAVSQEELSHISDVEAQAYSWASQTYDPDAGDTLLLVKNTSDDKKLHIDKIWISVDADTRMVIHLPTADVTLIGTTITGVNLNTTSANVAPAEAKRDETANSQGDVIWSGGIPAANDPLILKFDGAVILGKNKSIGVDAVSALTAMDTTIWGHFD